jgi:hypothetical protein
MQQRYHCIGHRRFRGGGLQLWRIPGNVKFPHREISGIPHPCVASACTTLLPDSSGTEEPTLISPHSTLLFTHLDTSHLQADACIFAWLKTPKDPRKHWKRGFDFAAVLAEKYRATIPTMANGPRPGSPVKLPPEDTRPKVPVDPNMKYPYVIDPLPDGLQTYSQVVRDLRRLMEKEQGHSMVHGMDDEGWVGRFSPQPMC